MSDIAELVYRRPEKSIGGIVVNSFLLEEHNYAATASEYAIDSDIPVSDNIRLKPEELKIEGVVEEGVVVSDTGASSNIVSVFDEFLTLRKTRAAVSIITGLKEYTDMYISDFSVPRKAKDGGSLMFSARLKKLNIVYLSETNIPSGKLGGSEEDKRQAAGETDKGSVSGNSEESAGGEESIIDQAQESVDNFVAGFIS